MVGGLDFSGKKVKTPTLPKAGRVGHLKNLNQTLRIDESQLKDWPPAMGHPAKAPLCISPIHGIRLLINQFYKT